VVVVACDDLLAVAIARADEEKEEEEVAGDKRFRTTVPSSKVARLVSFVAVCIKESNVPSPGQQIVDNAQDCKALP